MNQLKTRSQSAAIGTIAAARVIPKDAPPFIAASMYARWIKSHPVCQQPMACRLPRRLCAPDNLGPLGVHRQHRPQYSPEYWRQATST